jgi:hypothetical protein
MPRLTIVLLLALLGTTPAAAQSAAEPQNQSIGAAAHWALPHPGGNVRPGVQVTWRHWRSPHFGIGADVRWWRRSITEEINSPAQPGPEGVRIPSMQGRTDERLSSYSTGIAPLGRTAAGRVSVIVGAGPGFFVERRSHDTRINASHNSGSTTLRSFGVQGLTELELRATRRLSLFAGLRLELREVRSMESNSGYPSAGVRFVF